MILRRASLRRRGKYRLGAAAVLLFITMERLSQERPGSLPNVSDHGQQPLSLISNATKRKDNNIPATSADNNLLLMLATANHLSSNESVVSVSTSNNEQHHHVTIIKNNSSMGQSNELDSSTDPHSTSIAILDMLPWEVASIPTPETNGTCQPPRASSVSTMMMMEDVSAICCVASMYRFVEKRERRKERLGGQCRGMDNNKLKDHVASILGTTTTNAVTDDTQPSSGNKKDLGCDACRIVNLAMEHRLNISFWGDSITSQSYDGFICELQRRNYHVMERTVEPRKLGLVLVHAVMTTTISSPQWAANTTVTVRNFFQWRTPNSNALLYDNVLGEIINTTDVLVFNIGVHFILDLRSHFEKAMRVLFQTLQEHDYGNFTLLAYRESTAQHFDSPDGDYYTQRNPNTTRCIPMRGGPNVGWREPIVRTTALDAGFRLIRADEHYTVLGTPPRKENDRSNGPVPEMAILPFFNFTVPHHDLHPIEAGKEGQPDCTHFCSTPYLWLPVWRSLRLALERRLLQQLNPTTVLL
jgi:hypothetical protein